MTPRYTFTGCLMWGGDIQTGEAEVTCTYSVDWGTPASRWAPADPAEIVDVEIVEVDGQRWTADEAHWSWAGLTFAEATETLVEKLLDDRFDEMLETATEAAVAAEDRD
jgi:hypothetical protein